MIKLFIDDIREPPDHTWMLARTVSTAINAVAMFGQQIELISLDHDISHQVTVGELSRPYPCDETFTPVAQFIAYYYKHLPKMPKVVMHTSNLKGGEKMQAIIQTQIPEAFIERKPMGPANRLEGIV